MTTDDRPTAEPIECPRHGTVTPRMDRCGTLADGSTRWRPICRKCEAEKRKRWRADNPDHKRYHKPRTDEQRAARAARERKRPKRARKAPKPWSRSVPLTRAEKFAALADHYRRTT